MGQIKGKFIRLECDNMNHPRHIDCIEDIAGGTYEYCWSRLSCHGWKKKKGKWYCPHCVWNNLIVY